MKIKYIWDGILYECLLDFENITNVCYSCGSQSHESRTSLFNSESIAFRIEKLQELSEVDDSFVLTAEGTLKKQSVLRFVLRGCKSPLSRHVRISVRWFRINNVIKKMMKEANMCIAMFGNPLPEETTKIFLGRGRADRSGLHPDWPFVISLRLLHCLPGCSSWKHDTKGNQFSGPSDPTP